MKTIKQCFDVILQGDKKKSRQAARLVTKVLYSSSRILKYKEIDALVKKAPATYTKISEEWRQENFVVAISVIYFLHDKEDKPDFLFPWFFQLLLHPNGHIRYAVVRMFSNELGPLTVYVRVPDFKPRGLINIKPEEADDILLSLYVSLIELLEKESRPKYKKYKFISSLPVSSYKSIQMVMANMEDSCGKEYFAKIAF